MTIILHVLTRFLPAEDEDVSDTSEPITIVVIDPCQGVECQEHATCEIEEDGNTTCTCKTCDFSDLETADPVSS